MLPTGEYHLGGCMRAVEWRFVSGGFDDGGPARAWLRSRVCLLPSEPMTPWQRAVLLSDASSGISGPHSVSDVAPINCDLTLTMHRDPIGEWLHLDSVTSIVKWGGGTTVTALADQSGALGGALQTLHVAARHLDRAHDRRAPTNGDERA